MNAPSVIIGDHWVAALKYRAIGRSAADLRAQAADPRMMRGLALLSGISERDEQARVLAVAGAVDELAVRGLTPQQCYLLAGMDREFGPFPGDGVLVPQAEEVLQ